MDKLTEEFDQLQSLTKAEQMVALAKFLYTEMGERASPRLRELASLYNFCTGPLKRKLFICEELIAATYFLWTQPWL